MCGGEMSGVQARRQILLPDRFRTKKLAEQVPVSRIAAPLRC